MRSKNAARITPDDEQRFERLYALGCAACRLEREQGDLGRNEPDCGHTENHHFLKAGKRLGHAFTVPLGLWHHQGVSSGKSNRVMLQKYGPSFHKHTRAFRDRYGTDSALLAFVDSLLGEDHAKPKP